MNVSRAPGSMRGIGLIEVMVALLLVSIGFLAAGALFARSMAANTSAMSHTMIVIQSESILDAMRADVSAARLGAYNTTVVGNACPAAAADMASQQMHAWCGQLATSLGATDHTKGKVSCLASGDCTVTVTFDDSRAGPGGSDQQTVTTRGAL